MAQRFFWLAAAVLFLAACSSGKKAYERGDYYESVMKAVQRLRQNPGHEKSQETLKNAYPLAVDFLATQAQNEITSNSPYKWRNAIQAYTSINSMYEAIRQCPGCLKVIRNPKEYYSEIGPLKEKAAEESYNSGIAALMKGTREDAKRAYFLFQETNQYVEGYNDVLEYMDKAKFLATVKVVVEQIPVPARYDLSGGFFQDQIEEFLHRNYTDDGFVKFFTPEEAQSVNLQEVDQIMRIAFDDFSVGNVRMTEREETLTRDSVKIGETKVEGKTIPVYGTVKAKLTTYRKEVVSTGLLSMVILDARTGGVLTHRKFNGQYTWVSSWARFNGDERALTDEQLALCKLREMQPPVPQELFLEFTRPIYNQIIPAIRSFYQNY
ncbi:MAG: hypothetical protein DIU61_003505 [Bacteroidota bacterium]|nr:MAG: hypothetical protein DIU61_13325 [Bacteroidota bacterium]